MVSGVCGWFHGPAGKGRVGSSPAITVPRFQVDLRGPHAHTPMNSGKRNTHTLSLAVFSHGITISTHSECRFSGGKGTRYTESGWRANGDRPHAQPGQTRQRRSDSKFKRECECGGVAWEQAARLQQRGSTTVALEWDDADAHDLGRDTTTVLIEVYTTPLY
jgi:hypothetical protein